ncbi:MAG: WXG100 family type VII secretion target [Alphaproteobacteria bacterium]|nr:WXG100 family type VII secretion target [Alphaproteobacteria bacterium]
MTQIIVNPKELRAFAHRLVEHAAHVYAVRAKFAAGLKELRATWRDERYRQFDNELTATMAELDRFVRQARRYADHLEDKARKGSLYLNRSR